MKRNRKRMICLALALGMLIAAAACGKPQAAPEENAPTAAPEPAQQSAETVPETVSGAPAGGAKAQTLPETPDSGDSGSDVLVVYFSRTGEQYTVGVIEHGNTAIVAEMIAEKTGADLFEVLPADDHYPMTYNALTDVAKREQNEKARPAYSGELPDLAGYSTVFIGAPVWWGDWPMIMYTLFENSDFSGKTLIPFSTHEGSGLSGFDRKLAKACPGAEIGKGLAIRGNDAQNAQEKVRESVNGWLSELGF